MNKISERLTKQLKFIIEIDKIKHVFRKTKLFDGSRFENDAEHAWHIGVMALILSEYSNEPDLDISKVLKMVLIHDIVEIDTGDTIVYDIKNRAEAKEKEKIAAERIFGLLPINQKNEFKALWMEFEERKTAEAKFAAALDRFEPIMQNHLTGCYAWKKHGVTINKLNAVNRHIEEGSKKIWEIVQQIFKEAMDRGDIKKDEGTIK